MATDPNLEGVTLAEQVRNFTKPGLDEHEDRIQFYDRAYDIYRASGPQPAGVEPWQSKSRIKYAMYNIDTALVNIVGGAPRARILPRTPDAAERAKAFQSVLDYYTDKANLGTMQPTLTQQALIYGVTGGKTSWRYEERNQMKRTFYENPLGGDHLQHVGEENVCIYDGPWFEPWNVYDLWWDPFARDVDTAAYVILRSYPSKHDLKANSHLYNNLDKLFQSGDAVDRAQSAQDKRQMAQRKMRGRFEIWEIWTDDRLIVLGNREVVIRDEPNPHWHGRKPVVIANARPDLFKIQGISEVELIDHIQEALWTLQRLRVDNLKMTVMRGLTFREGGVPDPNMLILRPRFRWPVSDHDDIEFQAPPPLPPEAYQEESSLINQMETVTGISPYVSGNVPTSVSHTTATSVSLLQGAATRLLQFKAMMLNNSIWQRVFDHWTSDVQQFMTEPLWARVPHGNGYAFQRVEPWQVAGDYDLKVIGADETASKDQEKQAAIQLLQTLAPFATVLNWKPLVERIASAFDFPDPELLLAQQAPPQQMAPSPGGGAPPQGGQPQGMQPPTMGNNPLPPEVQAAINAGGQQVG